MTLDQRRPLGFAGSVGRPFIGERPLAFIEHAQHQLRLEVEVVAIQNFFYGVASPIGINEFRVALGEVGCNGLELRDREPFSLALMPVQPLVSGLYVESRRGPGTVQIIGAEAPAGKPAEQFHAVSRAKIVAYIVHGGAHEDD